MRFHSPAFPFLFLAAALAMPSACPAANRVPVTDPAELERLGYPAGATNVFRQVRMDAPPRPGQRSGQGLSGPHATGDAWVTATGFSFHPVADTVECLKGPSLAVVNGGVIVIDSSRILEAQLHVPHGMSIGWVDLFGYHDHATQQLVVTLVERCLPYLEPGDPVETILAEMAVGDRDGHFHVEAAVGHPVNALDCSYHARALMGVAGTAGAQIQLTKVRLELYRQ